MTLRTKCITSKASKGHIYAPSIAWIKPIVQQPALSVMVGFSKCQVLVPDAY